MSGATPTQPCQHTVPQLDRFLSIIARLCHGDSLALSQTSVDKWAAAELKHS